MMHPFTMNRHQVLPPCLFDPHSPILDSYVNTSSSSSTKISVGHSCRKMSSSIGNSHQRQGLRVKDSGDDIHLEHRGGTSEQQQHTFMVSSGSSGSLGAEVVPVLELPAPPDGGWGWVIVFSGFMCNLVLDGIAYSFGVLLLPLVEYFDSNRSTVSWVGSLLAGVYQSSGPIVGGLVNKFGCRPVCMAGGVVSCLALLLSTQANNVPMLMVTYGVLGGFGLGMIYLPAVVSCGYYFEKRRALATGIAVCGSGVGCIVFAPFAAFTLSEFGWKGSNVIFAGLCLNCVVFGALMRPLELVVKGPPATKNDVQLQPDSQFTVQLPDGSRGVVKRGSIGGGAVIGQVPHQIPLLHVESPGQSVTLIGEQIAEEPEEDDDHDRFEEERVSPPAMLGSHRLLQAAPTSFAAETRRKSVAIGAHRGQQQQQQHRQTVMRRNVSTPGFGRLTRVSGTEETSREHVAFGVADGNQLLLQPARRGSLAATVRPMARKDIFYGGSVLHLAEAQDPPAPSSQLLARYRHSVISIPRDHNLLHRGSIVASHLSIPRRRESVDPELLSMHANASNSLFKVLKEMLDLHLLANPLFLLICVSNVLGFLALYVPYVYLPNMMVLGGIPVERASLVVSAIGISNTLGRVFVGWLVDFPWVSSLLVTNLSLISSGLCLFCFPFCVSFNSFMLISLCLGLSVSAYISLTSIVLVDLLGIDALTSAFGLLVSFRGVSSILGPPLAGMIFEATGQYSASFFMAGAFFIVAGMVSQVAFFMHRARQSKM